MARNMVTSGACRRMGPIAYGDEEGQFPRVRSQTRVFRRHRAKIDEVVRTILDRAYNRTQQILKDNLDKLHVMAEALLAYETIDATQIDAIMEGRRPGPPADWAKSGRTSKDDRPPAAGSIGGPMPQT